MAATQLDATATFHMRLTADNGAADARLLPPLLGWRQWPAESLRKALKPVRTWLAMDETEAKAAITIALDVAAAIVCAREDEPLTRDEAAAIYIYTLVRRRIMGKEGKDW
jgi:hypothetical protein